MLTSFLVLLGGILSSVKKIPDTASKLGGRLWLAVPMLTLMSAIFFASTKAGGSGETYYLAKRMLSFFDPQEAASASLEALEKVNFLIRKLAHVSEYFLLAVFAMRTMRGFSKSALTRLFCGALIAVLYACTDEYHQSFVPGRTSTIHDVLIDSYGISLALIVSVFMLIAHASDRKFVKSSR